MILELKTAGTGKHFAKTGLQARYRCLKVRHRVLTGDGISDMVYYDDISGYDGKNIGHQTHRKGEDIDIRYPGTPTTKRFWHESTYYDSAKKDDKLLIEKLEKVLKIATDWKFTKNYVYKSGIKNASYAANHEHHLHIGHRE